MEKLSYKAPELTIVQVEIESSILIPQSWPYSPTSNYVDEP